MYGMSPHTLYFTLMDFGVDLEDKELQKQYGAYSGKDLAKTIYKRYFSSYTGVRDLINHQKKFAKENGYVESIIGRKIWIPEINSRKRKFRSYGERLATNGAIQGCLHGDSQVWVQNKGLKKLKDLPFGEEISIWSGTEFTKGIPSYSGKKEEYEIKLNNGRSIFCSKDHKFLTVNTNGNEVWKTIDDFSKVEKIRMSKEVKDLGKNNIVFDNVDRDSDPNNIKNISLINLLKETDYFTFGQLLGRLSSDGYVRKNKSVSWIYAEHETQVGEKIKSLLPWKFKEYIRDRDNRNQKVYHIMVNSAKLARELYSIGINQKIPNIAKENKEILRGFLSGYTDGDGGISGESINISFGKGKNKYKFSKEMSKAFSIFDIEARVHHYKGVRTNLTIKKKDVKRFCKKIGFINEYKSKKVNKIDFSKLRIPKLQGRTYTVKEVKKTGKKIPMYDILNTNNGYFMVDGIITHNSASDVIMSSQTRLKESMKLKSLGVQQLMQIHDEVLFQIPEVNLEESKKIIKQIMENPFGNRLDTVVDLTVSMDKGYSYYAAK